MTRILMFFHPRIIRSCKLNISYFLQYFIQVFLNCRREYNTLNNKKEIKLRYIT